MSRLSLPSTGSRRMSVRPLHGYYGKLRFLLCFLAAVLLIVPLRYLGGTVFHRTAQCPTVRSDPLVDRRPNAVMAPRNTADLPSSQSFLASMPGSSTPAGRSPRSFQEHGVAFHPVNAVGTRCEADLDAQSPWPTDSLSTLNPHRHRCRPKTRFRVVTNLARVGLAPTGNQCTVSINNFLIN